MPEPAKRDPKAPKYLQVSVKDSDGKEWNSVLVPEKQFSTGSIGYYAAEKIINPESQERYQVSLSVTLIGSKPK